METESRRQQRELKNEPWVMGSIGGAIIISLIVIFALLINAKTHMTLEAKCLPLREPRLERKGRFFRGVVPVEVVSKRSGYGASVMKHYAEVYNSFGGTWSSNFQKELNFTKAHCLCPGCNGTHAGTCSCQPRSKGCDWDPPEYTCYMYASVPEQAEYAGHIIDLKNVRFEKALVHNSRPWFIAIIFFTVLLCIAGFLALLLYLPGILRGDDGNGSYKPLDAYD